MRHLVPCLLAMLFAASAVFAEVQTKEETLGDRKVMVLENALVRLVVLPDPGGTVIEFTHKKSHINFVAGGDNVLKGRLGWGWKDYYALTDLKQAGKSVYALPYDGTFRTGPGYKAIFVTCEAEGRRFEREMRLSDDSAELTTLQKITNISDKPQRLQCRWHTYSELDDLLAEHACIVAPAEGGEARKCFIGSGWDHQFITADGFWLAANYQSGLGMWMTFKKEQSAMQITWTDYNHARKTPARGAYVAEPHPEPTLAAPGQSVAYESTFYPFTAEEKPEAIPLGMLTTPAEQDRARKFLAMVKPNLAAIGPYTMTPGDPPAGVTGKANQNRFDFSHRRRDRFALRSWGILDAMMAVPGVQDQTIRCRYYARLFDGIETPRKVSFRLQMIDPHGQVALEQTKEYTIDPAMRELDVRDDVAMTGLADGWYQMVLEGYVEGEREPIHRYAESRRLVGQARPEYEKQAAERAARPLAERPFVGALRQVPLPPSENGTVTVPIGVEEGGGLVRQGWPVRCGVPFAQGVLPKESRFDLTGPEGKAVPLHSSPMATWLDGSVKWLLVEFPADLPANGYVFYNLKGQAGKPSAQAPLLARDDPRLRGSEGKLLGLFGAEDLWWEDGAGQKYFFRLQGEGAGIVLEENGPNRAVIKATGWYFGAQDRPVCMGELRLEQYRGQSFRTLYHTVTYAGRPWQETLGSYGVRFQMPKADSVSVELDGQAIAGKQVTLFQRSSDGAEVVADGRTSRGLHSAGAVRLGKGQGSIGLYHRDFWQMAPKKLTADAAAGSITFSYWPREAGPMSFLPREDGWIPSSSSSEAIAIGMSRTHEIILDSGSERAVTAFEKLFNEPVVAITPPKYLASTKALLHLSPYDPSRYPTLERLISDTIDYFQSNRELFGWYGEWTYGGIPNWWKPDQFRWLDFGRYAWILNEEDIVDGPWLCFLRSGDRKYLKFAEINTRHLLEVGTIRWNPTWPEFVGLSRRHHECIWLSGGDTGHSMLDPFLDYYYATGYRPAREAAERMAGAMAQIPSGSWRYISNPVAGLARMYLDTQNPFYKEHADRIWNSLCYPEQNDWWLIDHGDRMVMWYSQLNPQCKELWKAWALNPEKKDRFTGADVLTALYLETGDPKYAQAAMKAVPEKMPPVTLTQHILAGLRAWCYTGEVFAPPKEAKK